MSFHNGIANRTEQEATFVAPGISISKKKLLSYVRNKGIARILWNGPAEGPDLMAETRSRTT